jgi:hypothetical protein
LDLKPLKRFPGQLLLRCPILESIGDLNVWKVLQDGALHGQLVEIGVQEGDYPLREWRRSIEIHGGSFGKL